MKQYFNIIILILSISYCSSIAFASDNTAVDNADSSEVERYCTSSIEEDFANEMMLFKDIPVVFSASRLSQDIDELSIPVYIIDSEDIHYSGATNIVDLFKYSLGIDVLPGSRNRYRMSMGGLRFPYNDRNVTLINGRSFNSPVAGGSDILGAPVFMEDIERIEVICGSSGAAAWGSNAFTGVINIVTKRPEDIDPGFFYSGTMNEYGDIYNHLRWADKKDNWQWRLSAGYEDWTSSEDAASDDDYESNDFARTNRFDSEVIVSLNDLTELSFGAAYNRTKRGDVYQKGSGLIFNPYIPLSNGSQIYEVSRFFARIDRKKIDDFGFHIQWFGNYEIREEVLGFNSRLFENDIELQVDYDLGNHSMAFGANFRHHSVDIVDTDYSIDFNSDRYLDYQTGLFFIDRWDLSEFLDLEFQFREDYFSNTDDSDWSGRFSTIMNISEQGNQKLKLSIGRAYRYATYGWRYISYDTVTTNPDVKNEQVVSYQLGYSFDCSDNVRVDIDGYYHKYKDTIGVNVVGFDPLAGPMIMIDNNGDVEVLGVQGKVAVEMDKSDLELWCSYEDADLETSPMDYRSIFPPKFKAGFTARYYLPDSWTLSSNYKYADEVLTDNEVIVDEYHDLTIAIAKGFADGNGELMIGVQNVFGEDFNFNFFHDAEEVDESVGRTFFGRFQIRF